MVDTETMSLEHILDVSGSELHPGVGTLHLGITQGYHFWCQKAYISTENITHPPDPGLRLTIISRHGLVMNSSRIFRPSPRGPSAGSCYSSEQYFQLGVSSAAACG